MAFRPKPRVKTLTADYTVLPSDNETIFVMGSGADIEITLPAVADAKDHVFTFVQPEDFEMLITAPDESIIGLNDATADAISFTTATEHIGAACQVVCNGSLYFPFNLSIGAHTVTVVSA